MIEAGAPMGESKRAPSAAVAERVLDLAHLGRMTLGEKRLEAEVLALFDRQAGMLLARMRGAPATNVAAFAHTIKGSARGIGAWDVAEAAARVERAAQADGPGDLAGACKQLATAVGEVRRAALGLRRGQ